MTSITQKINSVNGGISQQPDELKVPGQVVKATNVLPDVTHGLQKRPGSKLIKTLNIGNRPSFTYGKWFSYYRDENEQYIGQVIRDSGNANDGYVRIWRCSDGHPMTVEGHVSSILSYLQHSTDDDIQTLTLNDTTFIANRTKPTGMTTDVEPVQPNQAFVELKQIKFASQYTLDIFNSTSSTTSISTATKLHVAYTLGTTYLNVRTEGTCDSVGTQLFTVNTGDATSYVSAVDKDGTTISGRGKNLYFRITATGQPTTAGGSSPTYVCRYTIKCDLLFGGEGWETGDVIRVRMTNAASQTDYDITIQESSSTNVSANLSLVRPSPTPFDGETAVTADSILGALRTQILNTSNSAVDTSSTGFTVEQIGNGLYITRPSSENSFNINTGVSELLNVLTNEVQDVADLPKQCKDGYVVKVRNSANDEDDYYVKFIANRDLDGEGVWEECAEPGRRIKIDAAKMPIQLQRTAVLDSSNQDAEGNATPKFMLSQIDWEDSAVGSNLTAPKPSFISTISGVDGDTATVNRYINKMIFFRNRLVLLSDENVVMSRPGDFFNFFSKSAIAASAEDPIDLSCSSEYPAIVYDGIQVNTGLVLFTKNQQFMLTTDSDVLSPVTAKINSLSTYNFNEKTNPVSLGTTIAFLDNAGKFTRMFEMASVLREGEPVILEQSKVISKLFPKNINLIANSRENSFIAFASKGSTTLYGYKYFTSGEQRLMQSWITWELSGEIQYLCMLDDSIYAVVGNTGNYVLQRINLKLTDDATESITHTDKTYKVYLDNISEIAVSTGTYNASTNITSFPKPNGYTSSKQLAVYDIDQDDDLGVYVSKRSDGTSAVSILPDNKLHVDGDWSGHIKTINITNQGTGYTIAPVINFAGGNGSGAIATANIADGKVTSITINNDGYNYTAVPTISIGTPWQANQTYLVGQQVTNNGQVYTCSTAGTSASSGGPNGSGTNIADNTVRWNHAGVQATATATLDDTKFLLGYLYDMEVEFPKFFYTKQAGTKYVTDVQSNLIIHRIKLNFGPLGLYETTLKRIGKNDYVETFESRYADQYAANTLVIDPEQEVTLPIYERNTNYTLTLKSSHPSPATLYSLAWEGDYSSKLYKRV